MTEAPRGGQDSRPAENPAPDDGTPGVPAPHGDVYTWYQRGLELLGRGSPAAAAQLLERAAEAEPRFPQRAGGARPRPVRHPPLRRGRRDLPADRRGQPQRRLRAVRAGPGAGPGGNPRAAAEHLALAAAMRPELRHYTEALQGSGPPSGPGPRRPGTARRPRLTPRGSCRAGAREPRRLSLVLI